MVTGFERKRGKTRESSNNAVFEVSRQSFIFVLLRKNEKTEIVGPYPSSLNFETLRFSGAMVFLVRSDEVNLCR